MPYLPNKYLTPIKKSGNLQCVENAMFNEAMQYCQDKQKQVRMNQWCLNKSELEGRIRIHSGLCNFSVNLINTSAKFEETCCVQQP